MGGIFSSKQPQSKAPTRLNSIQINQSSYGNCIPLLYGTDRLPMILIDYVDFTATPVSQQQGGKGGGSKTSSSYDYSASVMGLLCEGPVPAVTAVFNNQSVTTLAAQNMVFFSGAGAQAPWSYMTQHHLDHALPYDHSAYIAAPNLDLGSSAGLPNYTFEVSGMCLYTSTMDAHPAVFLVDYCTDPNHGANFPYLAPVDSDQFQTYCTANNFFFSACEQQQRAAQDFINEVLQATNSNCVWSPGTGLRFVPYGDTAITGNGVTYTPNLTPLYSIDDSDYAIDPNTGTSAPVTVSIIPANQTFNCWRIEFLDRTNQYNTAIAEYRDELDVATNGLRVQSAVSLHLIKNRAVAHQIATLMCNRNLYIRNTFAFKLRADFCLLEPMDLIAINDSRMGIVNQLVRITDVTDNPDDTIEIIAEEMVVGPAAAPLYNNQFAQAYVQNFLGDPGPVAKPYMFTFPPSLAAPASNGYELGIAVGGAGGEWGGCGVYLSLDNITYWRVGVVDAPSRYGTTTQLLPAGNDPDTANSVSVQLLQSSPLTMTSGTRADADNILTPCIVDGEIISYQTAQALGDNAFVLTYLRRGKYGSTNTVAHPAGSNFAVIDQDIFRLAFDPGYAGLPFWAKFVSFNLFGGGVRSLSEEVAYQGFFQGQNAGVLEAPGALPLVARNSAVCTGNQIYKKLNAAAAWDSDCYSEDALSGGCVARVVTRTPMLYGMFGLNSDPLTDESFASLDYAWYVSGGFYQIYENGGLVDTIPITATTDTLLEIRYDGKFVTYFADNINWRTIPAPGKSLYFDCSLNSPNFVFDNVYFGLLNPATPTPFVARNGTSVNGVTFAKNLANTTAGWNADVYSLEGYPTAHVFWKVSALTDVMVGLGVRPGLDSGYSTITAAIDCTVSGALYIFKNGTGVTAGAAYLTTDVLGVTWDGTTFRFLKNGSVLDSATGASLGVPTGSAVYLDTSFYAVGAAINSVDYGPTPDALFQDTVQIRNNAATLIASGGVSTTTTGVTNPAGTWYFSYLNATPAPNYDCTMIITATLNAAQVAGTFGDIKMGVWGLRQWSNSPTGSPIVGNDPAVAQSAFFTPLQVVPTGSGAVQSITLQAMLPFTYKAGFYNFITGGTAIVVPSSGSQTINYGSVVVDIEFVIR